MYLNHTSIVDRDELHCNFTIEEMYDEIICCSVKLDSYKSFCRKLYPDTCIDRHLYENLKKQDSFGFYAFPQRPEWFNGEKIDADGLIQALTYYAEPLRFAGFCEKESNEALIRELAASVMFEEEAALLFLFMLLHIQAKCFIKQDGMTFMRKRLEEKRSDCMMPCEAFTPPAGTYSLVFERSNPDSRLLKELQGGWIPLCVSLDNTPFRRTLYFGDTLLYLESGGQYPVFLSRFRNWQDVGVHRFCRSILQTFDYLPDADKAEDPPVMPVLFNGECALLLTRSGRAIAGGREIARNVLDAAADNSFFYFALADGIATMPRRGGDMTFLCRTPGPVEEIDVLDGKIFWRRSDTSEQFSMPVHPQEG